MATLKAIARVGIHAPGEEFERDEQEAARLVKGGWAAYVIAEPEIVITKDEPRAERKRKG